MTKQYRTITIVNPHSGATVERDAAAYTERDILLFSSRMTDEESYSVDVQADSNAAWVVNMVQMLGAKRAGEIILS